MKKAAAYLRVSTAGQTVENQRAELVQMATARGYELTFYEETESAAKVRPVLEGMMRGARAGKFSAVFVWSLDRLDRNMHASLSRVVELDRQGVELVSVREPWLDTGGPARGLLVAIFGWVAEQERARLIDRTNAGLARARADGTRLGRPPVSSVLLWAAADRVEAGRATVRQAATAAGVPKSSLQRELSRRRRELALPPPRASAAPARP